MLARTTANWSPETRQLVRAALREPGATPSKVSRKLGLRRESVRMEHLRMAAFQQAEPIIVPPVEKPRYKVPYLRGGPTALPPAPANDSSEAIRVTVIGDLHVTPGQDLSRLKWIARHIGETQPDHIVQIGDWHSFDSVSSHDPIGSIKASRRPSLRQDMECLHESLALFDRELGPSAIPRIICLGNHEERVRRYEQLRSELDDSLWPELLQKFSQFGWTTYDYGRVVFIGGVGFVHVPFNRIGKPHSSPAIMANSLAHDLVKGHSHVATYTTTPKIGDNRGVTLIDVGTSLPYGHVESYAKLSSTGWFWGCHDITIRDGRIEDFSRISMPTLQARYA